MPAAASLVGADMVENWDVDFQNFGIALKFVAVSVQFRARSAHSPEANE